VRFAAGFWVIGIAEVHRHWVNQNRRPRGDSSAQRSQANSRLRHFSQLCLGDDMNTSTSRDFFHSVSSILSFKSLMAPELKSSLLSFYLDLDFDARRARFCGAVSDDAIKKHCRRLNPDEAIVLACSGPAGLLAAMELHPLLPNWEASELAIAVCATTDRTIIAANLLQLAAFAAAKRGCTTFIISSYSSGHALLQLLRGMGRVLVQGDTVRVELDGYAVLHGRESLTCQKELGSWSDNPS
jgi:hypothetical protein